MLPVTAGMRPLANLLSVLFYGIRDVTYIDLFLFYCFIYFQSLFYGIRDVTEAENVRNHAECAFSPILRDS